MLVFLDLKQNQEKLPIIKVESLSTTIKYL